MSSRYILVDLNLDGNEIQKFRVEALAADPAGAELFAGRLWFNTTDQVLRFYNGLAVGSVGSPTTAEIPVDDAGYLVVEGATLEDALANIDNHIYDLESTGITAGGAVTQASPTTVNVTAGEGDITTGGAQYHPFWGAATLTPPAGVSWVVVQTDATVAISAIAPTPAARRARIYLARVTVEGGVIVDVTSIGTPTQHGVQQLRDLMEAIGLIRISGATVSPAGVDLTVALDSGEIFEAGAGSDTALNTAPHSIVFAGASPKTFRMATQNGVIASDETLLPAGSYDVGGTVTAIPGAGSRTTIFSCYLFPDQENLRIVYGQAFYNSLDEAQAAIATRSWVQPPGFLPSRAFLLGWIIARKDATDLSDTGQARFLVSGRFGEASASAGGTTAQILDNFAATSAPTATDDADLDYQVGSRWVDVTNDRAYVCVDATVGAAIWYETSNTPAITVNVTAGGKTLGLSDRDRVLYVDGTAPGTITFPAAPSALPEHFEATIVCNGGVGPIDFASPSGTSIYFFGGVEEISTDRGEAVVKVDANGGFQVYITEPSSVVVAP